MLRCYPRRGLGIPCGTARAGHRRSRSPTPWPSGATGWPQSPAAPRHAEAGRAPLSYRPTGALHQQSGGARRTDDEAPTEDLRRLPLRSWCRGLRRDPLAPLDCEEARLGPAPDPDQRSQTPDCAPPAGLTVPRYLGSNDLGLVVVDPLDPGQPRDPRLAFEDPKRLGDQRLAGRPA